MAGLIWLWQQPGGEPEPEPEPLPPGQTWLLGMAINDPRGARLDPMQICIHAFGAMAVRNPAIPQIAPRIRAP